MGKYQKLIEALILANNQAQELGIDDLFESSKLGELMLAEELNHTWNGNKKRGHDAFDDEGNLYEYKIARNRADRAGNASARIAFDIPTLPIETNGDEVKSCDALRMAVMEKYGNLTGSYIANRDQCRILDKYFIDSKTLVKMLINYGIAKLDRLGYKHKGVRLQIGWAFYALRVRAERISKAAK